MCACRYKCVHMSTQVSMNVHMGMQVPVSMNVHR